MPEGRPPERAADHAADEPAATASRATPPPAWGAVLTGLLRRPRETFSALARSGRPAPAAGAVALYALGHAAFSGALYAGGYAPSRAPFGLAADRWYLWQSLFLIPCLLTVWGLMAVGAAAGGRLLGGRRAGGAARAAAVLGFTTSIPLGIAFLAPDVVVYALAGFDALGPTLRVTGPVALAWMLWWSVIALREALDLGTARAALACLAGLLLATPAAILVR